METPMNRFRVLVGVRLIATWAICSFSFPSGVAAPGYEVRNWTMEEGIPHPFIHAILQSADGYLWMATRGGLGRFDGSRIKAFTRANTPSFNSSDSCISLASDTRDQSLWVGTKEGVLRRHQGQIELFNATNGLHPGHVWCLAPCREGGVWAGLGPGPCRITREGKVTSYTNSPSYPASGTLLRIVASLLEDSSGKLWLANEAGVWMADPSKGDYKAVAARNSREGDIPRNLFQSKDQSIYWTTASGLVRFSDAGIAFFPSPAGAGRLFGITEDREETLWVGSWGGGLFNFSRGKFIPVRPDVFGGLHLEALSIDSDGQLWIGVQNGGLFRLRKERFMALTREDGLARTETLAVKPARDGSILIATSGGLNRWDGERVTALATMEEIKKLSPEAHPPDVFYEQPDGSIQMAHSSHGFAFELAKGRLSYQEPGLLQHWCNSIVEDGENLWLIHDKFVVRQRGTNIIGWTAAATIVAGRDIPFISEWRTNLIQSGSFISALRTRQGEVWVGSARDGIFIFKGDEFRRVNKGNGLESSAAALLLEDSQQAIWMYTEKGLSRFKNGLCRNIGIEAGMTFGPIGAMFEDGFGFFWFSAQKGVFRGSQENVNDVAEGRAPGVLLEKVGPPCNGGSFPSACTTKDGHLWFPSPKGALRFDPSKFPPTTFAPTLIESVLVDGTPKIRDGLEGGAAEVRKEGKTLPFKPGEGRFLSISFARPHLDPSFQPRFRHRLLGLSDTWIEDDQTRTAQYSGLRHGPFEFQVQAESRKRGWESPAVFQFAIAPHFYETRIFVVLCILGGVAAIGIFHTTRLRISRRLYALEQEHFIVRERDRIAADMHDVLGSSLTKIGLQTEIIRQRTAQQKPNEPEFQKLSQTVRDAVSELDEVIWLFQAKQASLASLIEHLGAYAEDFLEPSGLRLFVSSSSNPPDVEVSVEARGAVVLIVREALNNITKHAKASKVWLTAELTETELKIEIRDDGKGLNASEHGHGGIGFSTMRQRVENLHGRISIQSDPAAGTDISVWMPLRSIIETRKQS